MKIIEFISRDTLIQNVYGTPRWCLCNVDEEGNFVQAHTPAVCKDYAHEIVITNYLPDMVSSLFPIYGMDYDPQRDPISLEALRISYTGATERHHKYFDNNLKILEKFHDMGDVVTDLRVTRVDDKSLAVEADKYWISSPLHTSLFLALLRAMTKKKNFSCVEEAVEIENIGRLLALPWSIEEFLKRLDHLMDGWKDNKIKGDSTTVHNFGVSNLINRLLRNKGYTIPALSPPYEKVKEVIEEYLKGINAVFVYGTLKKGKGNHRVLGEHHEPFMSLTVKLPYRMVSLGGFPGLIKTGKNKSISGEIYLVDEEGEQRLDALEGYPSFYGKDEITIEKVKTKVYTLPEEKYGKYEPVESGLWR